MALPSVDSDYFGNSRFMNVVLELDQCKAVDT